MTDMIRGKAVECIALSVLLFGSAGCVKNEALETIDNFTILWSGAAYNNSFVCRNDNHPVSDK